MRFIPQNKKYSEYLKDGSYGPVKEALDFYLKNVISSETKSIDEFEKALWLANAGAATVSIGFVQASEKVNIFQYIGSCGFVFAIVALMAMKYVSAKNMSRDTQRFTAVMEKFMQDQVTDIEFDQVRDEQSVDANKLYKNLRNSSGFIFVGSCLLTIIGVSPWL